jgi:hypothetical protein
MTDFDPTYTIDPDSGAITDPGKFEGEAGYLPLAYDIYLDGLHDDDDGEVVTVTMPDGRVVKFVESDIGFVTEVV